MHDRAGCGKNRNDYCYNMLGCLSLRYKQIDLSTADRLISIFANDAGTPLLTLRSNAARPGLNIIGHLHDDAMLLQV